MLEELHIETQKIISAAAQDLNFQLKQILIDLELKASVMDDLIGNIRDMQIANSDTVNTFVIEKQILINVWAQLSQQIANAVSEKCNIDSNLVRRVQTARQQLSDVDNRLSQDYNLLLIHLGRLQQEQQALSARIAALQLQLGR